MARLTTFLPQDSLPPDEKAQVSDMSLNMDTIAAEIPKLLWDRVLEETEVGFLYVAISQWEAHPARIRK